MFNVLSLYLIAKFRMYMTSSFNSLPDHRILALCKLKASAGDNFNAAKMTHFFFENIVEKGENAGYQHSLSFPQCLRQASF